MPTDLREQQMFTDEFIGEVISILRIEKLHIDITLRAPDPVRVRMEGSTVDGAEFHTIKFGRTIGLALRKVREQLREETGR